MPCINIPQLAYSEFCRNIDRQVLSQRVPYLGTLILTYRCNQQCVHCYCNIPADDKRTIERELSYEEICHIIDEIAEAGCLWLLITGGEPLLREDFWDIYLYARKKGIFVEVFTNGTLITPELAERFTQYPPRGIEISIYGATKETHERITRLSGSWEQTRNGMVCLQKHNLPLALKTMLMSLNKHELHQMETYAVELGLKDILRYDTLIVKRLDNDGGLTQQVTLRVTPEEIVALDRADNRRQKEYKDTYEIFKKFPPKELLLCGGGLISFSISPYGELQPCDSFFDYTYDLRNGSFHDGWNKVMPDFRRQMEETLSPECLKCNMIPLCQNCSGYAMLEHRSLGGIIQDLCQAAKLRYEAIVESR